MLKRVIAVKSYHTSLLFILFVFCVSACAQKGTKSGTTMAPCTDPPGDVMCPMIYDPITCAVKTLDGGKVPLDSMSVSEGNTCMAKVMLARKICAMGISPKRMLAEDIVCTRNKEKPKAK